MLKPTLTFFLSLGVTLGTTACSGGDGENDTPDSTGEGSDNDDDDDDDDGSAADDDDDDGDDDDGDLGDIFSDIDVAAHPEIATVPIVTWQQSRSTDATWIEFSFEDDEWLRSPEIPGAAGDNEQLMFGVPEGLDVSFRLVAQVDGDGVESAVSSTTNGSAPADMPRAAVMTYKANLASDNRWMLGAVSEKGSGGYGGPHWIYIIDRKARVVWYHRPRGGDGGELNQSFWPRLARDGTHITIDRQIRKEEGDLLFTTLDYRYQRSIRLPGQGDCYDVTDDGDVVYNTGDALMEVAPDGSVRELWSCWLDRCYANAVNWDPASDSVLVSFPYMNSVARIDRETGEELSIWGDIGGWSFDPPSLGLDFNHWANISPDGTFMVSSHLPNTNTHLFMEFEIDEPNETLRETWTYGAGTSDWAEERGMVARVEGGNSIGNYGPTGVIVEVTPDGEPAWRVVYDGKLLGNNILVDDLYALNRGPDDR